MYYKSLILLFIFPICSCLSFFKKLPPNERVGSISIGGISRTYHLVFPKQWSGEALPLLIALHGRFGSGKTMLKQTGLDELSDKHQLVVVFPDGYKRSWADGRGTSPADEKKIDDVLFITSLINRLSSEGSILSNKVYVVGHSNGGFMAQKLAVEKPNLWKFVVSVSSQISVSLLKNLKSKPNPNVSVYFIAGTEDPLVPYYGGYVKDGAEILSVPDSVTRWKEWNECNEESKSSEVKFNDTKEPGVSLSKKIYTNCSGNKKVGLYQMVGVGHAWPGEEAFIPFFDLGFETKNILGKELISEIILENNHE